MLRVFRSPGQRINVYGGKRLISACFILSLGSFEKTQAGTAVEKPPLPCAFKVERWMEGDRTRAICRNKSRGLSAGW